MGLRFLFMDDNAMSSHSSCRTALRSEDIERMDWPARSRISIHRACMGFSIGRRLAARALPPVTIRELRLALQRRMGSNANNSLTPSFSAWADAAGNLPSSQGRSYPLLKDRMFLAGHPSQDVSAFSRIALHATFFFFNKASFLSL
ncbi:transposable element Tcb2 transposase [Trichonephila clavipes]|nr:transposable element Tcb2 transposase [Trichonephila clavipes]